MKLTYTLTEQDYIDFNLYTFKKSPTMQKRLLKQRVTGPVLFIIATIIFPRITDISRMTWAVFFLTASAAWYFYYPKKMEKALRKTTLMQLNEREDDKLLSETQMILTEEGIRIKRESSESVFNWDAFKKVEQSDKQIFIFSRNIAVHIIPKMAFSSSAEMEEFLSIVRNHINQ